MTDQPNGTLRAFAPELIFANPYQHHSARRFRGEEFDALVEDIRVNGIHQPPPARPNPEASGAVQLQMGHRRLAAWRVARPGEPFTVILKTLTDFEMLDGVIEENIHRVDLNDIERAQMIETYKQVRPDATNADLARVFGLKDPASISNIRKLLQLPAPIQAHVAENKIPDAVARQLVGVSKVSPKAAQKIADEVAAAPKSEKQDVFESAMRNNYSDKLVRIGNWSRDWLADAPVETSVDLGDGDHFIGACAGCVFAVGDRCARKICRDEKQKMFAEGEIARVSAKLKIPAAAPDEKTVTLFDGHYNDDDRARDLLNARKEIRALLRLAPRTGGTYNYLERVLGSKDITLVTTDKAAIVAFFDERNAPKANTRAVSADTDEETDAERAKRVEQEKKEMAAKRAARSKMWKSYYDALWLLESAARYIGIALASELTNPVFAAFVESEFCINWNARGAAMDIEKKFNAEIEGAEATPLRMANVALHVIAEESHDGSYRIADNEHEYMFETVRDTILSYCGSGGKHKHWQYEGTVSFGVDIENVENWDVPPIHKTEINCWQCGRFAGNMSEKLTKRDIDEEGWIDDGKAGVFCSQEHKETYLAAGQSEGEHHAETNKSKPKRK